MHLTKFHRNLHVNELLKVSILSVNTFWIYQHLVYTGEMLVSIPLRNLSTFPKVWPYENLWEENQSKEELWVILANYGWIFTFEHWNFVVLDICSPSGGNIFFHWAIGKWTFHSYWWKVAEVIPLSHRTILRCFYFYFSWARTFRERQLQVFLCHVWYVRQRQMEFHLL